MAAIYRPQTEVKLYDFLYNFLRIEDAEAFLICVATKEVIDCEFRFQPTFKRKVSMNPDDALPEA
jgi:hypothetical protein